MPGKQDEQVLSLIRDDAWMMDVLVTARALALPDWAIGAGFVRAKVWDVLHGYGERTPLDDVDLVYHDPADISKTAERAAEATLRADRPAVPWSVRNQARMHLKHGDAPYRSCNDALRNWLETPTCVAVTMAADGTLALLAPYGLGDLFGLTVRPTPAGLRRPAEYNARLRAKHWQGRWPRLTVVPAPA